MDWNRWNFFKLCNLYMEKYLIDIFLGLIEILKIYVILLIIMRLKYFKIINEIF